jgi:hypothetical protein
MLQSDDDDNDDNDDNEEPDDNEDGNGLARPGFGSSARRPTASTATAQPTAIPSNVTRAPRRKPVTEDPFKQGQAAKAMAANEPVVDGKAAASAPSYSQFSSTTKKLDKGQSVCVLVMRAWH